jgi:hypothetical protein
MNSPARCVKTGTTFIASRGRIIPPIVGALDLTKSRR